MNGKLLTFEGIDGAGKTTQIKRTKEYLQARGVTVKVFREPGGNALAEELRNMVLSPESDYEECVDDLTEYLLFNTARASLSRTSIIPAVKQGHTVILDRFYDSTTAYQGAGRWHNDPDKMQLIKLLNKEMAGGHEPDATFYLRISLETSKQRRADKADRMEQAGDDFYTRVIACFDQLAKTQERFVTIPEGKSEQEMFEEDIKPELEALYDF